MQRLIRIVVAVICGFGIASFSALAGQGRIEFSNYNQYDGSLPPEFRAQMAPLVEDVIQAVKAGGRANVRVIGHADFDAQGDAFVTGISQRRASSARQALLAQLQLRADLEGIPRDRLSTLVNITPEGLGTKQALFAQNRPMSERVKNRRVEMFWNASAPGKPPKKVDPSPTPTTFKVVSAGLWTGSSTVRIVGEQTVRFVVKNANLLGATLTVECEVPCMRQKKSRLIPPLSTVEIEFAFFQEKPIEWVFHVSSDSDAVVLGWTAFSHAP